MTDLGVIPSIVAAPRRARLEPAQGPVELSGPFAHPAELPQKSARGVEDKDTQAR